MRSIKPILLVLTLCIFIYFLLFLSHHHLQQHSSVPFPQTISHKPLQPHKLNGNFRCNRYQKGEGWLRTNWQHSDAMMNACRFENLCLTSNGEFVLFKSGQLVPEHLSRKLMEKPWVYTQGRFQTDRGVFRVKIESLSCPNEPSLFVKQCHADVKNPAVQYELSDSFSIIEEPVYALHRLSCGNVGHVLLENLNMVVTLMMQYDMVGFRGSEKEALNNHILFLDDVFSMEGYDWMAAYKYQPESALNYSTQVAQLFTKNPILQLCKKRSVFSIEKSPCRNNAEKPWIRPKRVLQTCFSQFYAGLTVDLYFFPYGREMIMTQMRNLAYTNLDIRPHPTEDDLEFLRGKDLVVAIHRKPLTGKHGSAIANADELLNDLSMRIPKDEFVKKLKKKIRVELVHLESLSIAQQIEYFSQVDVYISDQGSAVYYAMFMRDDSSVIMAPTCDTSKVCTNGIGIRMQSVSNVNFYNVLELSGNRTPQCVERPVPEKKNNCDPILPLDVMLDSVKSMLRARFRNLNE